MNAKRFYLAVVNARRGKIALVISIGGLITSIIVLCFAFSFGKKLTVVEERMLNMSSGLKEIRDLSSKLSGRYEPRNVEGELSLFKPGTMSKARLNNKTNTDSTNSIDSTTAIPGIKSPDDVNFSDTVKQFDTVKIFIPASTLSAIQGVDVNKLTTGPSVNIVTTNVDLAKTFNALTKYTTELQGQNQSLAAKLKTIEAEYRELAAAKGIKSREDDRPSKAQKVPNR